MTVGEGATPSAPSAATEPSDRIPFGSVPRPVTGDAFVARIRDVLAEELPDGATFDAAGRAALDGPDGIDLELGIRELRVPVDLGALLDEETPAPAAPQERGDRHTEPHIVTRTPATLRHARFDVPGAEIAGVPFDATLDVSLVEFEWAETADGALVLDRIRPDADDRFEVRLRAGAPFAALVELLREVAELVCARMRLRLRAFDVDVTQTSPTRFDATVHARVGRGPLSLGARVAVSARLEGPPYALHVDRLRITSANPLVAVPLLVLRSRIAQLAPRTIPLDAAATPEGHADPDVRFTELDVRLGERIEVRAALRRAPR